jgi:4-alpha-glucanotransferase
VYTGTHDNDTTAGWWQNLASEEEKRYALTYLGMPQDGVEWAFIRAAEGSVAKLCVIPLQDVLGLGSEARMNVPSKSDGNWAWRFEPGMLTDDVARKLAAIAEVADRDGSAKSEKSQREVGEQFAA